MRVVDENFQTTADPDIPKSIPADMHGEWRDVVNDLKARKVLTDAMLGSVESYILALRNTRLAQEAIETHGAVSVTAKGALQKNPAVTLLGKAQVTMSRLAAELGLTPAARSRRQMSGGDEGSDDQKSLFDDLMDF